MFSIPARLEGFIFGITLSIVGYYSFHVYANRNKKIKRNKNEADDDFLSLFYGDEKDLGYLKKISIIYVL